MFVCDGPNGTGCPDHFTTPNNDESLAHIDYYVNRNREIRNNYINNEGLSKEEAQAKADAECPIHGSSHVEHQDAVYETVKVVDTTDQEE